ncbi:conserved hypothetical protein [Xenorhabdus bovienii str. feltiae Moldova]|uniref:Uncharacterized protein n=2 Tax=Xenorhabdus bovienii TaxID=40576 RepID=A0A0B6XF14_XENBV|nr:conserved hypothetical protein [Xenorhabdus bovienii str. feltiae Moldova]CDM90899.1 conserved protein of unknown function [Xenorhabdus bovienii]
MGKSVPKFLGIKPIYHIVKGVVTGDAIGKIQKLPKPIFLGFTVFFNRIETFATADHGTNRNG